MKVTKQWQALSGTMVTLVVPSIAGIQVIDSDKTPGSNVKGVPYQNGVYPIYSEKQLWISIQPHESIDEMEVTVGNFM